MSNLEHGGWAESIHCLTVIKQTVGPVSNGNNLVATEMYINTRTDKMSRKNLYEKIGIYFFFVGGGCVFISALSDIKHEVNQQENWLILFTPFRKISNTQTLCKALIRKDTCF